MVNKSLILSVFFFSLILISLSFVSAATVEENVGVVARWIPSGGGDGIYSNIADVMCGNITKTVYFIGAGSSFSCNTTVKENSILNYYYYLSGSYHLGTGTGFPGFPMTLNKGDIIKITFEKATDGAIDEVYYKNNVMIFVPIRLFAGDSNKVVYNYTSTSCTPEDDLTFCSILAKNCGSVTANDNCGTSRTVSSCGTCTSPQTCTSGQCVTPTATTCYVSNGANSSYDYNNDNKVNAEDIQSLMDAVFSQICPANKFCDLNNDGAFGVGDVQLLNAYIINGCISSSCPASQVIMKLSSSTNAHGELWNGTGSYSVPICYSDIFETSYTGANPHVCTGTNTLLKLSSSTNAHAELSAGTSYNTNVCYGDLSCNFKTSLTSLCDSGYSEVIRLSDITNAHLENISGAGDYPIKICCKSSGTVATGDAHWSDMMNEDNRLSTTQVNDTVKLIWKVSVADGTIINFSVHENPPIDCTGEWDNSQKYLTATVTNGKAMATWKAKLCSNGASNGVYFNAVVANNGAITNQSNDLTIETSENDANPSTNIINPISHNFYLVGDNISFEQSSSDIDDDLKAVWNFDNTASTTLYNCLTTGNCNTSYVYSTAGTKDVKLVVSEISGAPRDKSASDIKEIYVYKDGINVFSKIASPDPESDTSISGTVTVFFNASVSYIANCSNCTSLTNCNNVPCPSGKSCYSINNSIRKISCYNLDRTGANGIGNSPGQYNLWFNWTFFSEGNTEETRFGNWTDNFNTVVEFNKVFLTSGHHVANLNVGYDPK